MVLVKILGGVDLISSIVFLMLIFNIHPWLQLTLFCAGILLIKGLFLFTGEPLSIIDLFSSFLLLISILFTLPTILVWVPAFLLMAKGIVSFL
jgi:hypothetical protein